MELTQEPMGFRAMVLQWQAWMRGCGPRRVCAQSRLALGLQVLSAVAGVSGYQYRHRRSIASSDASSGKILSPCKGNLSRAIAWPWRSTQNKTDHKLRFALKVVAPKSCTKSIDHCTSLTRALESSKLSPDPKWRPMLKHGDSDALCAMCDASLHSQV